MKISKRLMVGLIISFFIVLLSSCGKVEELRIGSVKEFQFQGMNDNILTFQIVIPIENPNHFRIHVKGSDLIVFLKGKEVGKVKRMDGLVIESHTNKDYTVCIKVEVEDLRSLMGPAMQLLSGKSTDVSLTGKIKVRSFLYQRTISLSNFNLTR